MKLKWEVQPKTVEGMTQGKIKSQSKEGQRLTMRGQVHWLSVKARGGQGLEWGVRKVKGFLKWLPQTLERVVFHLNEGWCLVRGQGCWLEKPRTGSRAGIVLLCLPCRQSGVKSLGVVWWWALVCCAVLLRLERRSQDYLPIRHQPLHQRLIQTWCPLKHGTSNSPFLGKYIGE